MGELISLVLPLVIFVAIMYFMVIRPQKKQMEKQQDMYDGLKAGDSVVTIGGLHGVIDEVNQEQNIIVLDCEGIYLTFDMRAVSRVVEAGNTVQNTTTVDDVEENSTNDEN